MKFLSALAAAAALSSGAQACIRIHATSIYNPLFGDSMRVQIWDNDDFYEVQSQGKKLANSDSVWHYDFGNGHHVDMWHDGRAGRVWLDNGWSADLRLGGSDFSHDCIIDSDNGCRLYESSWTSCLNDGFGNCGGYSCDLCNFNDCPR